MVDWVGGELGGGLVLIWVVVMGWWWAYVLVDEVDDGLVHEGVLSYAEVDAAGCVRDPASSTFMRRDGLHALGALGRPWVCEGLLKELPLAHVDVVVGRPVGDVEGCCHILDGVGS